jgi:hypothetical protein
VLKLLLAETRWGSSSTSGLLYYTWVTSRFCLWLWPRAQRRNHRFVASVGHLKPDCPSSTVAFHRFISTCATQKAPQLHHHFGFCGLGTHNNKLFHEIMILVSFVRGCGSLADQL